MLTAELRATTLADCVEDRLLDFMKSRNLQPGDSLPREEELAVSLKVSRHIVREGISRLKALDLVESRKRRGLVMKSPHPFSGLKKLADVKLISDDDARDLMETRIAMEIGLSDFIYLRRTPEKIQELRGKSECLSGHTYSVEQEVCFHSCLVSISGNRQASQFGDILERCFSRDFPTIDIENMEKKPSTHHEICDALENGTIEDFRDVMCRHFFWSISICCRK